jgi:hypothetical protein
LNGALVALRAPVTVSPGVSRRSSRSPAIDPMVIVFAALALALALAGCSIRC